MTTYLQKKTRLFLDKNEWAQPQRRRSESRLKTYPSSTDIRNWCDTVEDRRQHILELVVKGIDKCGGSLIPFNVLLDMIRAMANADISKLKNCMKQLWNFIDELGLTGDNAKRIENIAVKMDSVCKQDAPQKMLRNIEYAENVDECVETCPATERHAKERASIEKLITKPTIETRMSGPGKMVTRIKGLQPGYQVIDDPSKPTKLTIKPAKSLEKNPKSSQVTPKPSGGRVTSDKIAATEALCKEQNDTIEALTRERDELRKKLEACLKELDNFKKLQTVANPLLPISCQEEIEALEAEIKIMRSGNPSPEEEADIIRKEVQILKRYCSKLKDVESENEKLKVELGSRIAIKDSDYEMEEKNQQETLKDKLKNFESLTEERDTLANKVLQLEKQLKNLPANADELRNRSEMLDGVMEERDNLNNKLKMMRNMEEEMQKLKAKADRVDELERELKNLSKGDRSSGIELRKTQSRAGSLEVELQNMRCERDVMRKRIESMKREVETQKAKGTESEMLRLERDRLQIKLNEMGDVQNQYEDMMNKMKIFDNLKAERDMYKAKYEDVLDMECKCDLLKAQIDEARSVSRERDNLQKQVQDLEACICEQEDEIKSLVIRVDSLSKTENATNNRLSSYKDELVKKEKILASSQEQLNQSQNLTSKVRELEKLLHNAEHTILQKDCHIKCLENQFSSKSLKRDLDSVEIMRKELETAKNENRRLQEISNKMSTINGDDHVKKMLKQSECAVKRVVKELSKQYTEWDGNKTLVKPRGKFGSNKSDCNCHSSHGGEISSGDDCEKLREELEELQKEKRKLETTVKQLQNDGRKCPGACSN